MGGDKWRKKERTRAERERWQEIREADDFFSFEGGGWGRNGVRDKVKRKTLIQRVNLK